MTYLTPEKLFAPPSKIVLNAVKLPEFEAVNVKSWRRERWW